MTEKDYRTPLMKVKEMIVPELLCLSSWSNIEGGALPFEDSGGSAPAASGDDFTWGELKY